MWAPMTALRRRMIDDMTLRNLSPATQQSYVYAVAKFSRFFGRSPDQLGIGEVRAYQIHLAGRGLSWPHLNQVSCAPRFFFGVTLDRKDVVDRIVRAREPRKLPIVLSSEEGVRFLQAVPGLRTRVALTTAYSAGLRVSEVVTLQPGHIQPSRLPDRHLGIAVVEKSYKKAKQSAGLTRRFSTHALRHYAASRIMPTLPVATSFFAVFPQLSNSSPL